MAGNRRSRVGHSHRRGNHRHRVGQAIHRVIHRRGVVRRIPLPYHPVRDIDGNHPVGSESGGRSHVRPNQRSVAGRRQVAGDGRRIGGSDAVTDILKACAAVIIFQREGGNGRGARIGDGNLENDRAANHVGGGASEQSLGYGQTGFINGHGGGVRAGHRSHRGGRGPGEVRGRTGIGGIQCHSKVGALTGSQRAQIRPNDQTRGEIGHIRSQAGAGKG